MSQKVKMWICLIGGCFFTLQAAACFRQRDAFANLPVNHALNVFYGAACLIFCGLYFTGAFRAYAAPKVSSRPSGEAATPPISIA